MPLSRAEAIAWRTRDDAHLRLSTGNLVILDRALSRDELIERLSAAAAENPRLRERPVERPSLSGRMVWEDDPAFDPGNHVRTMAVPPGGDVRAALDLASLVDPSPYDPDRSPWDITVIDGLDDGRSALYLRAHHILGIGRGGISFVDVLVDEPIWPVSAAPEPHLDVELATPGLRRTPGTVTFSIDLTRAAPAVVSRTRAAIDADPLDTVRRTVKRTLEAAGTLARHVIVGPRFSPLPSSRSSTSRFAVLSIQRARAAALGLGGSRNDLLVAGGAASLGLYHLRLGVTCPTLRVALPSAVHGDVVHGRSWLTPTVAEVPTDPEHPGPQFGVVADRLADARADAAGTVSTLTTAAFTRAPTPLLVAAMRNHANAIDFTSTTAPGLRGTRHICGAEIESSYPFGPRLGSLINITAYGNDDRLDVGLAIDPVAVTHPELLIECMIEAFGNFLPDATPSTTTAAETDPVRTFVIPSVAES